MRVAVGGSAGRATIARPEVLRREGPAGGGRVIDLRRPPGFTALPSSRVTVVREREYRVRSTRVALGRDSESPLVWQRVAEAVIAAHPGDVVSVDVSELPELPTELVEFLRYADYVLSRRGGIFILDPSSDAVFTQVRFGA